jgi:hypothetical protein
VHLEPAHARVLRERRLAANLGLSRQAGGAAGGAIVGAGAGEGPGRRGSRCPARARAPGTRPTPAPVPDHCCWTAQRRPPIGRQLHAPNAPDRPAGRWSRRGPCSAAPEPGTG